MVCRRLEQASLHGQSAVVGVGRLIERRMVTGRSHLFRLSGIRAAGAEPQDNLVDAPLRVGIRAGGAVDQGQAQLPVRSPVTVLAVADQDGAGILRAPCQAVLQTGHVVVDGGPADGTGRDIVLIVLWLVGQRDAVVQDRDDIAADSVPVHPHVYPHGALVFVQAVSGFYL